MASGDESVEVGDLGVVVVEHQHLTDAEVGERERCVRPRAARADDGDPQAGQGGAAQFAQEGCLASQTVAATVQGSVEDTQVITVDGDRAEAPAPEAVGATTPVLDVHAARGIVAGAVGAIGEQTSDVVRHRGKTVFVRRGEGWGTQAVTMKLDQSVALGQRCVVNPVERGIREIPARTVANGVVFIDQIDANDLKDGTLVRYRVLAGVGKGEPLPASAK